MRILVGGISPGGEQLLNKYLEAFAPDANIEPLKAAGIKTQIRNHVNRPDVAMVIIDEALYEQCKNPATEAILNQPKVHKYINDEKLNQFLISKFGKLEGVTVSAEAIETSESTVDMGGLETANYTADFSEDEIITPVQEDDSARVRELESELEQSQMMIRNLTKQLKDGDNEEGTKEYIQRIKALKDELDELKDAYDKLEASNYENLGKVAHAEDVLKELKGVKDDLRKARESIAQLEFEKGNQSKEIEGYVKQVEELQGYKHLEPEYNQLKTQVATLKDRVEVLQGQYETIKESNDELQTKLTDSEATVVNLKAEKRSLELERDSSSEKVEKLKEKVSGSGDLKIKIGQLTSDVMSLKEQLADADADAREKTQKVLELQSEVDRLRSELSNTADVDDLQKQLEGMRDLETSLFEAQERVRELEEQVSEADNSDLEAQLDEKEMEITNLDESWQQKYDTLERRHDQLQQQYDALIEDTEADDLRIEVDKLRAELESKGNVSSDEVAELRTKCAELELDLAGRDEVIEELEDSVFMQLYNSALPKVILNALLPMPTERFHSKFTVVAGGTAGCNEAVYKTLHDSCNKVKGSVLLIDLSMDTSVDVEFAARGIKSPANWLSGAEGIDTYLTSTSFSNVKVVSVGLAYINPLYLLNVDWIKRLSELDGVYKHIIINVGYLTNMVDKILFQSFKQVMKGCVVVKATPTNIRATMLALAGLNSDNNMSVYCTEFHNVSESFYKKLASKYKTSLLNSNSVMEV